MDLKANTGLVAPSLRNISCSHPRYVNNLFGNIGPSDILQAFFIIIVTIAIVGANLMVIFVINSRRYALYIHPQPRYLLTSLALNDLAIGLLITPFGSLSALFHCWPYGEIFCQIQALLRGALSEQSAVILVCMAVDRYLCALHPRRYHQHSSKKGCVAILSITWILCLTFFSLLVLPKGYHFNAAGLLACEPFFSKSSYRILSSCALYFPTTMVLMYCYGSSFHASRYRLTSPSLEITQSSITEKMIEHERRLSGSTSRTMAAISLGFIVIVTPWTIQEIVAACTGSKIPPMIDFFVTWVALSNSFWNPFLYWLLNAHFRRICKDLLTSRCSAVDPIEQKSRCCSISFECDHMMTALPLPPGPPSTTRQTSQATSTTTTRPDIEGLSEKYWGEILERTLSSNSLHALSRTYGHSQSQQQHNNVNSSISNNIKNNGSGGSTSENGGNTHITFSDNHNQHNHRSHHNHNHIHNQNHNRNLYLSTSEPRLCEHDLHDINCAKNKAFFTGFDNSDNLPDI